MDIKRNPAGLGWMVRYDNETYTIFYTQKEAVNCMAKIDTAKAIISAVKSMATATDQATDLVSEYWDVGTFVDEDVAALGITAAQLTSCITLLEQVDKLMTNQETSSSMYRTTLNQVRRVVI